MNLFEHVEQGVETHIAARTHLGKWYNAGNKKNVARSTTTEQTSDAI